MTETVSARYEFNDKEAADLGREIAEIYLQKLKIDEEEKAAKDQIKERRSALELRSGALSRQLNSGFEMRQVDCTLQWDHPNVGEVTYWRKDNGASLKVRAMTMAERQLELPLEGQGPQLLEFPQQVESSVEKSEEAVASFFKDKEATSTENVVTVVESAVITHPEPPPDWQGSQEEYEASLRPSAPPVAPVAPPEAPKKKDGKKKS